MTTRIPTAFLALVAALTVLAGCGGSRNPVNVEFDDDASASGGLTVTEVLDDNGNLTTFYDYDSDGNQDAAVVDHGADGSVDAWWYDSDDDGRWDRHTWDSDGDGVADFGETDWNRDGNAETFWTDLNGNGQLDPGESIELDEQPFNGPSIDDGVVIDRRTPSQSAQDVPPSSRVIDTTHNASDDTPADDIPVGDADMIPPGPEGCTLSDAQYRYGLEERCIEGYWHDKARYGWACDTAPYQRESFAWIASAARCVVPISMESAVVDAAPTAPACDDAETFSEGAMWQCNETWQLVTSFTTVCADGAVLVGTDVNDTHAECSTEGAVVEVNTEDAYYSTETCTDAMLLDEAEGMVCLGEVGQYTYGATYGCADGSLEEVSFTEVTGDC